MPEIKPSVTSQDILCQEAIATPNAMVVFGASGNLARNKLFGSIFSIFKRGLLSENFYLLGCGRTNLSDQMFRKEVEEAIKESVSGTLAEDIKLFVNKLYFVSGNYNDEMFYENIKERLSELDIKHKVDGSRIFYLAVPPAMYSTIVEHLRTSRLSCIDQPAPQPKVKLVVEKPFGHDLQSAVALNSIIRRCFDESQIYRIDHYLGKETVQNLLMFRFANAIFEPIWNRNYIDHIQITIAESIGIEGRGSYYDKTVLCVTCFKTTCSQCSRLWQWSSPFLSTRTIFATKN